MTRPIVSEQEWRARQAEQSGPQEHACFVGYKPEYKPSLETAEQTAEWERIERWREWTRKPVKDIAQPAPYQAPPDDRL